MRYAHFAPEHLETALHFNPLATMKDGDKVAADDGYNQDSPPVTNIAT